MGRFSRISLALCLGLSIGVPGQAGAGARRPRYVLEIALKSRHGHIHRFGYPVGLGTAWRIQTRPGLARPWVEQARRDYNRRNIGYRPEIQGERAWLIIPGLRVDRVKVKGLGP